ncbi:MAG: hypothetical protein JWO92_214 [Chitinophagaceae bacterium]|nr:hypothetical protein [Chitinophagaceae bacterium]MDB5222248.1 hypothetical protein [Chitinophagaceae bacterium]
MKSYKLNIKVIIATVGTLSLVVFSIVLIIFHIAKTESLGEILLHYGFIIAPVTILWVLTDRYFWYTKLFQSIRKTLNIPPDLRGRWEGILENADGSEPQKFVIEVTQTLTTLLVHSFSSIGHSEGILCEIASSHNEDKFTLCYLWKGEINTSIKDINQSEQFDGYTMLQLHEYEVPKTLIGSYFTNKKPSQTRGGIELKWVSQKLRRKLE